MTPDTSGAPAVVRLIGLETGPVRLALMISYADEAPDGRRSIHLADLPDLPEGGKVGRVGVQLAGEATGRWLPPYHLDGGRITVTGDTVRVDYPPGWRGTLGEAGLLIEGVTAARWNRHRLGPTVGSDQEALDTCAAWAEVLG